MKYIGSTSLAVPSVDITKLSADELQFRGARYELVDRINQAGHYGCLVRKKDYKGGGIFSSHLYPVDAKNLRYEERGEIKLDALYDKRGLEPVDLPHITDRAVRAITEDKFRTYQTMMDLQPQSMLISSAQELPRIRDLDNGSGTVVVKSLGGSGGSGVRVGSPDDLLNRSENLPKFPLIAQEFIETSGGVPGLIDGRHDVRVIILNGEPLGGSVRSPRTGGYLSNTHQGGSMRMLALDELPKQLLEFAALVDRHLPDRPRLYAADFMYSVPKNRWYLVELNASPGALPSTFKPVGRIFQEKLLDTLLKLAGA